MLLSIEKNNKTGKLHYYFVHNAEELCVEAKLSITNKKLKALRKSLQSETEVVEVIINEAHPQNPILVEYDEIDNGIRVVVFEKKVTHLVATVEGGIIQDIKSDSPATLVVLDVDKDSFTDDNEISYLDETGDKASAVPSVWAGKSILHPEWVKHVHQSVNEQAKNLL